MTICGINPFIYRLRYALKRERHCSVGDTATVADVLETSPKRVSHWRNFTINFIHRKAEKEKYACATCINTA